MFGLFFGKSAKQDIWTSLDSLDQLDELIKSSSERPIVLFKHSTRCSISSMALNRIEQDWTDTFGDYPIYYLDLIQLRPISNAIAEKLGVEHQSPQIIVVSNGKSLFDASHGAINAQDLKAFISN